MLRTVSLAAASFAAIVGLTQISGAEEFCGSRDTMVKKLASEFKENPMAVGLVDKSAVLEIFVSTTGTWTIIATGTDGNSCVVSAGEGWQSKTLLSGSDV